MNKLDKLLQEALEVQSKIDETLSWLDGQKITSDNLPALRKVSISMQKTKPYIEKLYKLNREIKKSNNETDETKK
jgi:hypothetical protein